MQPTMKRFLSMSAVLSFFFALLVIWLAPVDLQVAGSRTEATHSISTATVAKPSVLLVQQHGVEIRIEDGAQKVIGAVLAQQLAAQLGRRISSVQIQVAPIQINSETIDAPAPHPLLLVEITNSEIAWTPLWSEAEITAQVVYASDGDISWRNAVGMIMGETEPAVHARGTIQLTDASQGLFSQFGYRRHLGEALGHEIYKMMESPLFDPPGS